MKRVMPVIVVMFSTTLMFCKTKQVVNTTSKVTEKALVYKTKADYSSYVPVTLSTDKKSIVAYPSPSDVFYDGQLAKPTALVNGYWLDNRGVGVNTAFLKITYEDYSRLKYAPQLSEMMQMILDADPLLELYVIDNKAKYKDNLDELNKIIKKGGLKKIERLK
ncbi:MAG: hypothetical protein U0T74_11205 [Chitinophagales bacterium]